MRGNEQIYRKVKAAIGEELPEGLVVHIVVKAAQGLKHLEVWDSKGSWESFRDERVRPAVAAVVSKLGVSEPPPAPAETQLDVVDVWKTT
ncbi:MAG: hypothetical protein ACRDKJ_12605 [Actinomycetota bacterium]